MNSNQPTTETSAADYLKQKSPEEDSFVKENPLLSLAFNVFIPVLILNKGNEWLGPTWSLIVALAFPLTYGLHFAYISKKVNFISLLGFFNVLFSGGFALSGLTGIWFAVKEATFPLLIGIFVLISAWTTRPFVKVMLLNPQVFRLTYFNEVTQHLQPQIERLFKNSTLFFSGSFLISAVLNFGLAYKIFLEMDPNLSSEIQAQVLNEQIAEMTIWSLLVIALPMMIITGVLMVYFFRELTRLTGKPWQSFLNDGQ